MTTNIDNEFTLKATLHSRAGRDVGESAFEEHSCDRMLICKHAQDYVAELTKPELPERFTPGLRVVMFAQLGYLVEVAMENSDVSEIPLEYQVSLEGFERPEIGESGLSAW